MWQDLLTKVEAEQTRFESFMQPPATDRDIEDLRRTAKTEFKADLPSGYVDFLKRNDGFNWNGVFIYGTKTQLLKGTNNNLLGLVEANRLWREREDNKKFLFFGDANISRYCQDLETGEYKELDRQSDSLIGVFKDFPHMLTHMLESSLM